MGQPSITLLQKLGKGSFLGISDEWEKFLSMKQELALESKSAKTCTRGLLLVLIVT